MLSSSCQYLCSPGEEDSGARSVIVLVSCMCVHLERSTNVLGPSKQHICSPGGEISCAGL